MQNGLVLWHKYGSYAWNILQYRQVWRIELDRISMFNPSMPNIDAGVAIVCIDWLDYASLKLLNFSTVYFIINTFGKIQKINLFVPNGRNT